MGPSKVLETRSEAEAVWLEAKEYCGLRVLGSSLAAEVYSTDVISSDGDWFSKIRFKFNEVRDGVIAVVVKRRGEYFPFFLGVKSQDGQPKAVLDKVWASPVSRFGAIDVFDDGFCALRVRNEAGETCSTSPLTAESAHILDGDLLCRYLQGLAGEGDLLTGIETPLAGPPGKRRAILALQAGQRDAEDIKSQEPRAEERKTLKVRLAEQEERIAELEAEMERQEKQAVEREEVITSLIAEIKNCQAASAKDREEMERMSAELEVLRPALASREADLAEREKQVAELRDMSEALSNDLAKKGELVTKLALEKAELGQEAVKQGDQIAEAGRAWARTAVALKEVIERSWFFKRFPSVREALEKFPLEKEV